MDGKASISQADLLVALEYAIRGRRAAGSVYPSVRPFRHHRHDGAGNVQRSGPLLKIRAVLPADFQHLRMSAKAGGNLVQFRLRLGKSVRLAPARGASRAHTLGIGRRERAAGVKPAHIRYRPKTHTCHWPPRPRACRHSVLDCASRRVKMTA